MQRKRKKKTMKVLLPSPNAAAKLFATGMTVGPMVDSLHNQCLLQYDLLPIALTSWPEAMNAADNSYLFCSSWTVPPLLGVAYVILGGVLPRICQAGIDVFRNDGTTTRENDNANQPKSTISYSLQYLRAKAVVAVLTTAMIIKLSEYLTTHENVLDGFHIMTHDDVASANLLVMFAAALSQWAILDGSLAALLAASITSVVGPLSELPFVAHGFWHYLPQAGDYLPLANVPQNVGDVFAWLALLVGDNYRDLALSSITGPCYFAVTMDAIALGRWFDSLDNDNDRS